MIRLLVVAIIVLVLLRLGYIDDIATWVQHVWVAGWRKAHQQ